MSERKIAREPDEVTREFFVTHIGVVKVNNYGAVEFAANVVDRVIVDGYTLGKITSGVREIIAAMRKDGVYAR